MPKTSKPEQVPVKNTDGSFKTDKDGMIIYRDVRPDETTQGGVTHTR